ncbi:X-linked interleukin-1 receptor accessory protein-like 2 isoform X1 [Rhynchophorus ferrugineus]|uniref:X-linked interleukin-1 receptor accessory protein-like 2 isoform X1 n=1 Tax=Rhynchophorus ferrugineus TaxID=354439 RepID=UPI003FCCD243
MAAQTVSVLFIAIGVMDIVLGIADHCSLNTLQVPGNDMDFTKEATNDEFAIVGKFKGLHCCAKGYRSIEWYKDGKMYPWDLDRSRLIIYPESANQTISTSNIRQEDEGNYTCVLRNDTVMHSHTINLRVFDKLPDDLKMTYVPQSRQAYVGEHLRLFCEAFAGRLETPDPSSAAIWHRKLENGTLTEVPKRVFQERVSREEGQTFGTYLVFPGVRPEDFGVYTCRIYKPGAFKYLDVTLSEKIKVITYIDPNPFPLKEMVLSAVMLGLVIITVLIVYRRFALRCQVYLKDRFSAPEDNDGKQHDVLVAYSPKDSELASGVLVSTLEKRGYVCQKKELSLDVSNWNAELAGHIESCRRIITVISPATVNDSWISSNLYQALKQLQTLGETKLICVALKELPTSPTETKNSLGETLASVAHSMNIITWHRNNDYNFWLKLYKDLPPKRAGPAPAPPQRPRLTSERSFDSLVVVT